ncbi:tRNA-histidine guanylyltransferase 1-like [Tieghemiomyces parasiticus]|uniref:tRNA(His) guanylyltransferase n=1 Tax=Tieghemiomyces parasiticus TaxID=78921 RepID=A0A9W8E207_9FUNG|nr:tRNA-histidine guanylyltransferase 1-like [Tieghemiomyces parasiticus]
MANSQYEYVKVFEQDPILLPNTWLVVRIDGQSFHRFSSTHEFEKPNDSRSLHLMNRCATYVFDQVNDVCIAYGESDEYSFVLRRDTEYYGRRAYKLASSIGSIFTARYVFHWSEYFPDIPLKYPPSFDSRVVAYPTVKNLRDYLSWRQADCHINNQYNTCFWKLVQSGVTKADAEKRLSGTLSANKNELLFTDFNTNYNDLPAMYRKGSIVVRDYVNEEYMDKATSEMRTRRKMRTVVIHEDLIGDKFWNTRPHILGDKK